MITLERVKELMGDPAMSDGEAEAIRDACYAWAQLAREALRSRRRADISGLNEDKNSAPERA